MRIKNPELFTVLYDELTYFHENITPLDGITSNKSKEVFIKQLIDSMRRIEFVFKIADDSNISHDRKDPNNCIFDPLKASILHKREGNIDEAFWLVFLAIHFGKHKTSGWGLTRDIYGSLGGDIWTWERITNNPVSFTQWLTTHYSQLTNDGTKRKFGNHRKYESLKVGKLDRVLLSYVEWVSTYGDHSNLIIEEKKTIEDNIPHNLFKKLYKSMNTVFRFGRTAKFDYLTMLAKLDLVDIEPDSTYMIGATGPKLGAKLLLDNDKNSGTTIFTLEERLLELESKLSIGKLGMQVLEDALCNWQKQPHRYVYFSG